MTQFVSFGSILENCHHLARVKMGTIDTICSAEAQVASLAGAKVRTAVPKPHPLRRLWAVYLHWLEKRESRWVLRYLTDDQLNDIGLTRNEAAAEAKKSFFWD
jgi:uncharacterized protein YjiS (DUF1127 family)